MKIISGGQTGVDRGALDAALDLNLDLGGWCPNGRRAEDGVIPERYPLTETPESGYPQRTEWNVRDAEATLILHTGEMGPGTKKTIALCKRLKKSNLVIDMRDKDAVRQTAAWISAVAISDLNVAGPRESNNPGIQARTHAFMVAVIKEMRTW